MEAQWRVCRYEMDKELRKVCVAWAIDTQLGVRRAKTKNQVGNRKYLWLMLRSTWQNGESN
jgi:hypothetical protein